MRSIAGNFFKISVLLFVVVNTKAEIKEGSETTTSSPTSGFTTLSPPQNPDEITTTPVNVQNEVTEASFPPNLEVLFKKSALNKATTENVKPYTVLEYQPITSFYHPHPVTPAQLIPPGTPWPDSVEGYQTSLKPPAIITTIKATSSPNLVQTVPELAAGKLNSTTVSTNHQSDNEVSKTTTAKASSHIVLDYTPFTSFYHPRPVTVAQLIPPGKPWPDSAEGHKTTLKPSSPSTILSPDLVERFPELTAGSLNITTVSTVDKGSPATSNHQADNGVAGTTTEKVSSRLVLTYKPITSFYHPNPVTPAQLIPPGKPWPASEEGYQTTSRVDVLPQSSPITLIDRLPELTTSTNKVSTSSPKTTVEDYVSPQTVLEYKPSTSFHHPNPVTVGQIIPPGKPWPASGNGNKTGPSTSATTKSTFPPNLVDRFPELTSHITTRKTTPSTPSTTLRGSSTHIVLEYKPQRPWYHPRPGNNIGQIIPPGKPWPASSSGYPDFSVTKLPPWLRTVDGNEDENNGIVLSRSKPDLEPTKGELRVPEPNALQYYEPIRRTTPAAPFTSGTQKTTISDIIDILKEVHNITLTTNKSAPIPSHLFPFDIDAKSPKESLINPSVIRPPVPNSGHNYVNVARPQQQQQAEVMPRMHVYDGTPSFNAQTIKQRTFPNPKYVPERSER